MSEFECKESGFYETRDGRVAEVLINRNSPSLDQPVMGYIEKDKSAYQRWWQNGYSGNAESSMDLVKYLGKERPKKKKVVKMAPGLFRNEYNYLVVDKMFDSAESAASYFNNYKLIRWLIDTPYAIEVEVEE